MVICNNSSDNNINSDSRSIGNSSNRDSSKMAISDDN